MPKQPSFRHHYVPQWYQKGFLDHGATSFKILDLAPPSFQGRDGRTHLGRSILDKGPNAWFFESELYTTRYFGEANDDIEKLLFGPLDQNGKTAITAYRDQDWGTVSRTYADVFEFMDALCLRTPKGMLRWPRMGVKDQNTALILMQRLRKMHCLMWAEGVLEIVRAPQNGPGFIFSDHPVTFYNRYVFPMDKQVPLGADPHQHWMGTQTLFPFDKEHLFILTHLEWANKPGPSKARKPRTNARLFDNGFIRWDQCIRKRVLTPKQVLEVNFIIKARALRYIAGRSEADLFPERHLKSTLWSSIGHFLMPPQSELFHFGGETYITFKDGHVHYQDQFGRRPATAVEAQRKAQRVEELKASLHRALANQAASQRTSSDNDPN
ncbi:hypothetical protein HNP29_002625 [Pseudomonas alcaligenes]|nr:hypothetical protein [Pseudomonas alcaligenes]